VSGGVATAFNCSTSTGKFVEITTANETAGTYKGTIKVSHDQCESGRLSISITLFSPKPTDKFELTGPSDIEISYLDKSPIGS
jgi:hypothetical protein